MARYPARYYDGLTARSRAVEVEIAATGLAIFDEAGPVVGSWPGEGIRLVEKLREGEPVRLGLAGTTARLIVDDPGIVASLGGVAPRLRSRQRTSGRAVGRIALWAVLAAGSLTGIVLVIPSRGPACGNASRRIGAGRFSPRSLSCCRVRPARQAASATVPTKMGRRHCSALRTVSLRTCRTRRRFGWSW